MSAPLVEKTVKVNLDTPTTLPTLYSTNFLIQHTKHEFVLTFFEARPPALLGSADEVASAIAKIESVPSQPLARIVIAASRMKEFIEVVRQNFENYEITQKMEAQR